MYSDHAVAGPRISDAGAQRLGHWQFDWPIRGARIHISYTRIHTHDKKWRAIRGNFELRSGAGLARAMCLCPCLRRARSQRYIFSFRFKVGVRTFFSSLRPCGDLGASAHSVPLRLSTGLVFARGLGYPGSRLRLRCPDAVIASLRLRGCRKIHTDAFGRIRTCVGELARGLKHLPLRENFALRSATKMRARPTPTDAER